MPLYEKHFTLQEARGWLPDLRRRFNRIHELYAELQTLKSDYDRVQELIRSNGHAPKDTGFEGHLAELQELVQDINAAGIEIKDVERGLVDFPHMREGEEVYLCWELREPDIHFWHRIEDGYAGREPL
jgi:hypothetical protein